MTEISISKLQRGWEDTYQQQRSGPCGSSTLSTPMVALVLEIDGVQLMPQEVDVEGTIVHSEAV